MSTVSQDVDFGPVVDRSRCKPDPEYPDALWVTIVGPSLEAVTDYQAKNKAIAFMAARYGAAGAIDAESPAVVDDRKVLPHAGGGVARENADGSVSADAYRHLAAVQTLQTAGPGRTYYAKSYRVRRTAVFG